MADVLTPAEVASLWFTTRTRYVQSRNRIRAIRRWLAHMVEPEIPAEFMTNADVRVKLPHAVTTSLHTVSVMGRKRPLLKRVPLGAGFAPQQRSSKIEAWTNGALAELECQNGPLWKPLIASLFNQGECGILAYPMTAHWEQFPEFDSENPATKFQRDSKDRGTDDEAYAGTKKQFKLDGKKTRSAYDSYVEDWAARRIPLVARVVPAEQCLPLFGPGYRLDALLVRSEYAEDHLRLKGYRWAGEIQSPDNHPGVGRSQGDSTSSLTRMVTLIELWRPGSVTYYVGPPTGGIYDYSEKTGQVSDRQTSLSLFEKTWFQRGDQQSEATIDLDEQYGLDKLLATYCYGMHFADEEDPDRRGVPFLWPFLNSLAGLNNMATAHMAYTWKWAYLGPLIQPDKDTPIELLLEDGKPRRIDLKPMTATVVPGTVAMPISLNAGPDADKMQGLLMGSFQQEGPSTAAFGGGQADSGHERSLIRAHLEDAYGMVLGESDDYSGALGAWRWLGQTLLECGTAVAASQNKGIPVYTSAGDTDGYRRKRVDLTQELAEQSFDLEANYPPAEGENLPYAQLLAEWAVQGLIPEQTFLEKGMGDQSPEQTIVMREAEKFLFKTPQGQQLLNEMVAKELGGQQEQEAFKLQQAGRMGPDGTPVAAQQGLGQMMGTAVNNPTTSGIGGMMSGALESGPIANDQMAQMQQSAG